MGNMLEDLLNPENLPDTTSSVTLVQTHISLVFVADHFVYKVKKPVNFGFLDFTTLEKRHYYCQREVELNRRLAEDLYIGVLPVREVDGRHTLGKGEGRVVDYAVKMKRIPEESLMKNLFEKGRLSNQHLTLLAQKLARFHQTAERNPEIDKFGLPEVFKVNTDENFQQVEKYVGQTIDRDVFNALSYWTEGFYSRNSELFHDRIKGGRIRDCHGDLHMEHISFYGEGVAIFDCIEFNDRFRYSDTIADTAFLLMDLEYYGGGEFSRLLWQTYAELSREGPESLPLLTFYKVYRAFVRGKVISFQLDDPAISEEEKKKAAARASSYFQLAYSYLD